MVIGLYIVPIHGEGVPMSTVLAFNSDKGFYLR